MIGSKVKIDGITVEITDMWIQGGDLYVVAKHPRSEGTKEFMVNQFDYWIEVETGEECFVEGAH